MSEYRVTEGAYCTIQATFDHLEEALDYIIYKAEYSLKAKKSKLAAKDNADLLEMFGEIYN